MSYDADKDVVDMPLTLSCRQQVAVIPNTAARTYPHNILKGNALKLIVQRERKMEEGGEPESYLCMTALQGVFLSRADDVVRFGSFERYFLCIDSEIGWERTGQMVAFTS